MYKWHWRDFSTWQFLMKVIIAVIAIFSVDAQFSVNENFLTYTGINLLSIITDIKL